MCKLLLCAGLLFVFTPTLLAQHTDAVLNDENSAFHNGLDEKNFDFKTDKPNITKDLLNALPQMDHKSVIISTVNTGRRKGSLRAEKAGKELFSAGFKRNFLEGPWQSKYSSSQLIDSGTFHNNVPDGEWRSWYPDGSLRSIRTYNADKWFGIQSEVNRKNTKIFYHQFSRMVNWKSNSFESLTSSAVSFASLPSAGIPYQPPFKFCLHHGLFMNFYPNGSVKDSGYYKEGLRDGLWKEYYSNGQVSASGSYFKGLKNSGWKFYDKEGRLTMLAEYKHGRMVHHKTYRVQYSINP